MVVVLVGVELMVGCLIKGEQNGTCQSFRMEPGKRFKGDFIIILLGVVFYMDAHSVAGLALT